VRPPPDPPADPPLRARVPIYKNLWVWTFIAGIVVLTAIRPLMRHIPEPPPVLGEVPAFSLIDQDGRPFGSADLRGNPYVVSFFFTRCPSICPTLMRQVRRLQDEYVAQHVAGVRLVSISVDPDFDTPARLREYGRELGVLTERWTLLTGDLPRIRALAEGGFKVPVGSPEASGTVGMIDIAHTGKVVLVDGQGRVRGYYDTDDLGLEETLHRSRRVLSE